MMDYTKFNVEDFAANESFIDWVNQSDPEAVKFWEFYISSHPEIRPTVEKARALVINLRLAEEIKHPASQIESIWDNIDDRVTQHTKSAARGTAKVNRTLRAMLVPFIFLCVCVTVWFVFQYNNARKQFHDYSVYQKSLPEFVEQVNETGKPLKIQLADGSVVTLESKSRLKYKANYLEDSTRDVYLMGEAFFEVAKNLYKPFIVHSNEVFTKVLGTSFRVVAPENGKQVIVSVRTGKVSVYAMKGHAHDVTDKKEGVILLPNQQVSYEREGQSFEKMLVAAPEVVNTAIIEADFVFDNTPIAKVFKTMETAYGIEILFNEETMKNCFLTAPLGSDPMLEKLRIICQTIGASYEIIDAKIVISSSGC